MPVGVFMAILLAVGIIGYKVYQTRYQHDSNRPGSSQQSTVTPQTQSNPQPTDIGIDYPAPQGIKGQVFCNDKVYPAPCQTKLDIQIQPSNPSMTSNGPITTIETDAQGRFEYDATPGTYIITPAPKSAYPIFVPPLPNPIIVKERQVTEITITYHSGLR